MNTQHRNIIYTLIYTILLSTTSISFAEDAASVDNNKPVTEKIVDKLTQLASGPHKGYRANHAKGTMAEGIFIPSKNAAAITAAPHFQSENSDVTVRFSNGTGVPKMPDASPNANPHGLAIRFKLADNSITDIVSISINSFPSATPEEFLELLTAAYSSGPDSPKPTPIEKYLGSHPAALKFVSPRPAPVSFATLPFYGVNSFKFTNSKGEVRYGRYLIKPLAGSKFLTEDQSAKADPNYLMDEIVAHLKKSEVKYLISVQIADKADVINDPTVTWPDSREVVELGTLVLKAPIPDSDNVEKTVMFNPLILPAGIEPSDDPILLARPASYAVSYGRRLAN